MNNSSDWAGRAPKRTTLRGWLMLAALFGPLPIGLWGRFTNNDMLQLIGFGPLLATMAFAIVWSRRKAARDPEFAAHVEDLRQKARQRGKAELRGSLIAVGVGLSMFTLVIVIRQSDPAMAKLMLEHKLLFELGSGVLVVMLILAAAAFFKPRNGSGIT